MSQSKHHRPQDPARPFDDWPEIPVDIADLEDQAWSNPADMACVVAALGAQLTRLRRDDLQRHHRSLWVSATKPPPFGPEFVTAVKRYAKFLQWLSEVRWILRVAKSRDPELRGAREHDVAVGKVVKTLRGFLLRWDKEKEGWCLKVPDPEDTKAQLFADRVGEQAEKLAEVLRE